MNRNQKLPKGRDIFHVEHSFDAFDFLFKDSFEFFNRPHFGQKFTFEVEEQEDFVRIKGHLPNINREQVKLNVNTNQLLISVKNSSILEEKNEQNDYYKKQETHQMFERVFLLPFSISKKDIMVTFEDKILDIRILKNG